MFQLFVNPQWQILKLWNKLNVPLSLNLFFGSFGGCENHNQVSFPLLQIIQIILLIMVYQWVWTASDQFLQLCFIILSQISPWLAWHVPNKNNEIKKPLTTPITISFFSNNSNPSDLGLFFTGFTTLLFLTWSSSSLVSKSTASFVTFFSGLLFSTMPLESANEEKSKLFEFTHFWEKTVVT